MNYYCYCVLTHYTDDTSGIQAGFIYHFIIIGEIASTFFFKQVNRSNFTQSVRHNYKKSMGLVENENYHSREGLSTYISTYLYSKPSMRRTRRDQDIICS
jgi:hypothetical protein